MWKYKIPIGISTIILIVATAVALIAVSVSKPESQQPIQAVSINLMTPDTIKNDPDLATASGVRGLVEVGLASSPESGSIFASRGERVTIPIFISFTSYDPDLKSLDVLIDLSGEIGPQVWEYWHEYDAQGSEINSGAIRINDLISYSKEGIVTIGAGDRVEFDMFVDIPSDLPPLETESIMLSDYGISLKDHREPGIVFSGTIAQEIKLNA